ncbi:uncharacterized protein LOC135138241 [Zophobas morio]|uniref:uncharacterized protein LOC135138241 n=1 Tax=Zophobas morio TaxID=2755281 RepID=UPI00308363FC
MKTIILSICVLTVLSFSYCTHLPFKKCNIKRPNFEKCLSHAIQDVITQLDKPIPAMSLPSMDPWKLETLNLDIGNASEGLQQIWRNVTVRGFSKPTATDARWTPGSVITLDLAVSYDCAIVFTTEYEAHGAVLLLPVDVVTSFRCDFVKGGKIKVTYKIQKPKKANGHFKLISTKVVFEPKKVKFNVSEFFENQSLTAALNSEMNKNWEGSWNVLSAFVGVYDPFFDALLRGVLEKFPADQIVGGLD